MTVVNRNNYLSARINEWDIVPDYGTIADEDKSSPIAYHDMKHGIRFTGENSRVYLRHLNYVLKEGQCSQLF